MTITLEKIKERYASGHLSRLQAIREVYYSTPEKRRSLHKAVAVVDALRVLSPAELLLMRGLTSGVFDDAPGFKADVKKLLKGAKV